MKFYIILIVVFFSFYLKAQDTLYVYDTIYIYDTIKVYDTVNYIKKETLKRVDNIGVKTDSSYLKNKDTLSATILNNDIIVERTIKKIEAMKKVSLLGVLFIALQNITLAQHDLGVKAGFNAFGTIDNVKEVSNPISSGVNLGIFYIHNFNEKIRLEFGANYLYNLNNKKAELNASKLTSVNYKKLFNNENNSVNDFDITEYKTQIGLPLLLNFKLKQFTPKIGAEWRYKTYRKETVFDKFIYDIGIKAGICKSINDNIYIEFLYYQGLSNEQDVFQDVNLKSFSLSTSIRYQF